MPHPTKLGWSRILYSTSLKLFPCVPDFVVKLFTGKALTDVSCEFWLHTSSILDLFSLRLAYVNFE